MHPLDSHFLAFALGASLLAACLPHYLSRRERAQAERLLLVAARLQRWCRV